MDVITAVLYGHIDQVIYVELPHSYGLPDKVALLNKAFYGLEQAPHLWYKTIHDLLTSLGLHKITTTRAPPQNPPDLDVLITHDNSQASEHNNLEVND